MISILIVDDEALAINSIVSSTNWEKLEITQIYTASNATEAKQILSDRRPDIILSDIEMPGLSGIDLLRWIKNHKIETVSLLISCHSDFTFAKAAIQLGCLDYLVKPVSEENLEAALKNAVNHLKKNQKQQIINENWRRQKDEIVKKFWLDIIEQRIPSVREKISEWASIRDISFDPNQRMQLCLIKIEGWKVSYSTSDKRLLEFSIQNMANEILFENNHIGMIIEWSPIEFLALIFYDPAKDDKMQLRDECLQLIRLSLKYTPVDLNCYIDDSVDICQVSKSAFEMKKIAQDNVSMLNEVCYIKEIRNTPSGPGLPNTQKWLDLLKNGYNEQIKKEIRTLLDTAEKNKMLSKHYLIRLQHDILQIIYTVLRDNGIQAHQFMLENTTLQPDEIISSKYQFIDYYETILDQVMTSYKELSKTDTIVNKAVQYIEDHLSEQFTREDIAAAIFLSPDYLSRIFKKSTNKNIVDFIIEKRIDKARYLLAHTNLSITAIAEQIGFGNLSHFSTTFKKYTGERPLDYRKKRG